jgi:hypothetical protein
MGVHYSTCKGSYSVSSIWKVIPGSSEMQQKERKSAKYFWLKICNTFGWHDVWSWGIFWGDSWNVPESPLSNYLWLNSLFSVVHVHVPSSSQSQKVSGHQRRGQGPALLKTDCHIRGWLKMVNRIWRDTQYFLIHCSYKLPECLVLLLSLIQDAWDQECFQFWNLADFGIFTWLLVEQSKSKTSKSILFWVSCLLTFQILD